MNVYTIEEITTTMKEYKKRHPDNLTIKYFDADYFLGLDTEKLKRFAKLISTCIVNPNGRVGSYAMDGSDYDDFRSFFEPIVREYHRIPSDAKIEQPHEWCSDTQCDLGAIDTKLKEVSMRVRVARNVKSFPLPGAMGQEDHVALEDTMIAAFKTLIDDPAYGGQYLSLTPGSDYKISDDEFNSRVAAHQMFKNMVGDSHLDAAGISSAWPYGRGMYISAQEDFIIWVGEEDHLRIMAMKRGGDLTALFKRLEKGLKCIEAELPGFAESPDFGYITSCPTNLGGGMRASLHLKLPKLTKYGRDLTELKSIAKKYGLSIRGRGGEYSDVGPNGTVDVSPNSRLGVTEKETMQQLYDGTAKLWEQENKAI